MYPITYNFKRIALANKVTARDNSGAVILFAHQKMLKLREKIIIFADTEKTHQLGELNADKVLDFSVTQTFSNTSGRDQVKIRRAGRKSIWRAHYEILSPAGETQFVIREQKAWVKVADTIFSELPILGFFAGYFFNPKYNIFDKDEKVIGEIAKQPSFFESNYTLQVDAPNADPLGVLPIATLTVITRERMRG